MIVAVDYLTNVRAFYAEHLKPQFGQPIGASENEISQLESDLGVTFPSAYRQFLLWMGNDHKGAFRGSEWYLKDIVDNQAFLPEFLSENGVANPTNSHSLCFFSHQGYMAGWFDLNDPTPDPECHFYSEAFDDEQAQTTGTFSAFLLRELRGIAEAMEKTPTR